MMFSLTVPGTDVALVERDGQLVGDGFEFGAASEQIWDLVRPERRSHFDEFADSYSMVRAAEQRALTPNEVRALPQLRADHPLATMWVQRANSFERLGELLRGTAPGLLVDIGAGCGWLSAHFVRDQWHAAAVDVTVVGGDGLEAARHHHESLVLARAEMEALPFASNSVDLAVFNAALHYAASVTAALDEAARIVRPGGHVVVLDSPVFNDPAAGHAMVAEFAEHSQSTLGVPSAPLEGSGFILTSDLDGLNYRRHDREVGLRAHAHRWRGKRRAGREVASRPIVIATIGATR